MSASELNLNLFPVIFIPMNECSQELSFLGAKVPGNIVHFCYCQMSFSNDNYRNITVRVIASAVN